MPWPVGVPRTPEQNRRTSETLKGIKRRPFTAEHREKLSKARKANGEAHHAWQGNGVGYRALHFWVSRKLGKPNKCQKCERIDDRPHHMHWANISGKYFRDISDWIRLCAKCHGAFDSSKRKPKCI